MPRLIRIKAYVALLFATALWASGCATKAVSPAVPSPSRIGAIKEDAVLAHRRTPRALRHAKANCSGISCITHVVIIVQENRSFNNIFDQFPGATTQDWGNEIVNGQKVTVSPLHNLTFQQEVNGDLWHVFEAYNNDFDAGKMDGWAGSRINGAPLDYAFDRLNPNSVKEYWTLASTYALADNFFPTQADASFAAHLNLVAGNTILGNYAPKAVVDIPPSDPWGCDGPAGNDTSLLSPSRTVSQTGPLPCFTASPNGIRTLADVLDNNGVSWAYYAPKVVNGNNDGRLWSIFDAIQYVRYGPDWNNNVISPPKQVLSDAASMGANFPNVTWVVPTFQNSDHAGSCDTTLSNCKCATGTSCTSDHGPSWVASVVNTIGSDTALWNHTAIFVVWDDWGGWYDPVSPPQPDYRGLGIRVPCIVISPYVRRGVVLHARYEFGSILQFIEQVFGNGDTLGPIGNASAGYTDRNHMDVTTGLSISVNSMQGAFDFTQAPAPFQPITSTYPASLFLNEDENTPALPPDSD